MTQAVLAGLKVLDLTNVVMGPYATQQLADYGAEVIKIEPLGGDTTRFLGKGPVPGMGPGFVSLNRGKKSVAIDLKQAVGRDLVLRLARDCDALVCNLRPQAMQRLGLDYPALAAVNPGLVYLSLVGYGSGGRYAGKPAYDDLIQAVAGLPGLLQRAQGGEPRYVPLAMCDRTVGLVALNALLAALLQRARTGLGRLVEVPMFETMAALVLSDHLGGRAYVPPVGPMGYARLLSPQRRPYATRDGYLAVMPYNDAQWRRFFEVAGRPDLPDSDARFADIGQRTAHIDVLYQLVAELLKSRDNAEWLALLEQADIPAMPLHSLESLLDDPHLADVGLFQETAHASEGRMLALRNAAQFGGLAAPMPPPAPRLGEHSRAVLRGIGLDEDELDRLEATGIVGSPKTGVAA